MYKTASSVQLSVEVHAAQNLTVNFFSFSWCIDDNREISPRDDHVFQER